jgi:molecular chaperone GrpE
MMPREMENEDTENEGNGGPGPEVPEKGGTTETAELEQALEAEKKKAQEYLASWQRAQADFTNFKRRNEQERLEFNKFANASLLLGLLPVLDDLERAIEAIPTDFADHDWVEGVRLVERKFKTSLEGQGVKPILALGMAFDPNFHEAIRQDKGPEGMVVQEFQKGYTLNGKLLRPAKVVVGNGEEPEPAPPVEPEEE